MLVDLQRLHLLASRLKALRCLLQQFERLSFVGSLDQLGVTKGLDHCGTGNAAQLFVGDNGARLIAGGKVAVQQVAQQVGGFPLPVEGNANVTSPFADECILRLRIQSRLQFLQRILSFSTLKVLVGLLNVFRNVGHEIPESGVIAL